MVLKAIKKFFEKKLSVKTFLSKKNSAKKKTNLDKKKITEIFQSGNFLKFLSLDIFQRSHAKQCFSHLEHILSMDHLHPMQCLVQCNCCYVTKWVTMTSTLDRTGQNPEQTVPACPVQIRAHHHINVCADINKFP